MTKLFAMEDNSNKSDSSNELLIDKVLEKAKQPKSPLSLTADILQQRQELKADIDKKLAETPEPDDSGSTEDNQDQDENDSSDDNNDTDTENKEDTSKDKNTDDESGAEDKDSLKSMIGSGLNKEEDNKEDTATESYTGKVNLSNIFSPINNRYNQYKVSLETYNLSNKALSLEEQPVVYVKESVTQSLNNLIKLSNNYIENNKKFVETTSVSVKDLNERITVFKGFVDNQKYHFTNKLVNDKDILANISCPTKSDPRETIRILLKYIESTTKATSLVVTNDYDTLKSSYTNSDFIQEEDHYAYRDVLPGFNSIHISLVDYKNYLTTKLQEFQYYKLKVLKTEDLFNLDAVTIAEDKELHFLLSAIDKLIVSLTIHVDNLNDINTHFTTFIDEVKVIIYDIEQNKYKDLASVEIDAKVKDFIKFKLAIEAYYININMMIDYLTSIMSLLNVCVELKD